MQSWIDAARDQIQQMIANMREEFPRTEFRVGFVGYRDYGDHERTIVLPFSADIDGLRHAISRIEAAGGSDIAEDVVSGLQLAENMFHTVPLSTVRHIIHIADAPAHGMQFHPPHISDRFPRGDPSGADLLQLVRSISQTIDYTFVRIDSSTDTMIEQFHNSWNSPRLFRVADLRPQSTTTTDAPLITPVLRAVPGGEPLTRAITATLTASISHYTASQDS